MDSRKFFIAGREIGAGRPCFVIAEAGVNHNGDLSLAKRLVDAAARAGADAVKFQSYKTDSIVSPQAPKAAYQLAGTDAAESQYEMLRRLELSRQDHIELVEHCRRTDIMFLSTPFDRESADLLDSLDVPAFKIPSGEINNLAFLSYVSRKKRPMIISTGMATLGEVEAAVSAVEREGIRDIVLLHCVSNYPADPFSVNLRAMKTMETAFGVQVGYSDHTLGSAVALAAVALGAAVIEKHFTLDRNIEGPDHRASIEPEELAELISGIRTVEAALGHGRKEPAPEEADTSSAARKSLVAVRDIPAGAKLSEDTVAVRRPGTGLPPAMLEFVLGRSARMAIPAGTLISLEMLA